MKKRKKVALITAGASGIGQVIAELFLANQWNVHICDINKDYIDKFLIANPNASASHIDVGSFDQVEHMFHELEGLYQNLDVLINNAGIAGATDEFENISNESWIKTLNININSLFIEIIMSNCDKYVFVLIYNFIDNLIDSNIVFFD